MRVTCIGGLSDGAIFDIDTSQVHKLFRIPKPFDTQNYHNNIVESGFEDYCLERVGLGGSEGAKVYFLRFADMSMDEAMEVLNCGT